MRDHSNVDANDMVSIIKGTVRGKISVVFVAIGIMALISYFTGSDEIGIARFIIWILAAAVLLCQTSKSIKAERAKNIAEKNAKKLDIVKKASTKRIGDYLYVNESKQTWCVPSAGPTEYAFTDLIDFSVVQDEEVISSASLLNTVAGGAVFGLAGVLVGANKTKTSKTCSKLQVQMNVNSISNPVIRIDLLPYEVKRSDDRYKKALETMEEITGVLRVIKSRNQH